MLTPTQYVHLPQPCIPWQFLFNRGMAGKHEVILFSHCQEQVRNCCTDLLCYPLIWGANTCWASLALSRALVRTEQILHLQLGTATLLCSSTEDCTHTLWMTDRIILFSVPKSPKKISPREQKWFVDLTHNYTVSGTQVTLTTWTRKP